MDFVNETPLQAKWTLGFQADGREVLVVAVKGTFLIPERDVEAPLGGEQVPMTEADAYTGEPGLSAPLYESDFAHRKHRCDVLLNGSAHAPGGRPAPIVPVSLSFAELTKAFAVTGRRLWRQSKLGGLRAGDPEPFTVMPVSYDTAFGGVDASPAEKGQIRTFLPNPVGKGYHHELRDLDQKPMPCTQQLREPVTQPRGPYVPMALGAVGRSWLPRYTYAGTYDEAWTDHRMPFFPEDFDDRYFQAAPQDQQLPHPRGGERIVLQNLSPKGVLRFRLPRLEVPVAFIPHQGAARQVEAVIDTVLIEPDLMRLMLTWRITWPLRQNAFELKQVVVGGRSRGWFRAREVGKPYYLGLGALARAPKRPGQGGGA